MAPNKRVVAAYRAMGSLGIDESKVKSAIKKLLKVFDKNWELIEAENYRVLVDAIFEEDDNMVPEEKKKVRSDDVHDTHHSLPSFSNNQEDETECEEAQMHNERAQPLKRLRLRGQDSQPLHPLTNIATSPPSKRPKLEDNALHQGSSGKKPQNKPESSDGNPRIEAPLLRPPDDIVDKGKQPASAQVLQRGRELTSGRSSPSTPSKERTVKSGKFLMPNNTIPRPLALIIPKDEPIDEVPDYGMPIAVIHPEPSRVRDSSFRNGVAGKHVNHDTVTSSACRNRVRDEDVLPTSNEEATCNVEIASSTLGEVKLSLSCSSALWGSNFHMPSRDELIEMMEAKCLRSYKIADPNFSVMKLLMDVCNCMLELRNNSNNDPEEGSIGTSNVHMSKESQEPDTLSVERNKELDTLSHVSNGSINVNPSAALVSPHSFLPRADLIGLNDAVLVSKMDQKTNDFSQCNANKELEDSISPNSHSLVIVPQHQLTSDDVRSFYNANDLTKGEENVEIPWVNEYTNDFPASFNYIPQNLVFQDAYVNISLSRIGSEDCCSTCMGNCVLSPCACANKTGGEFAYSSQGLLREEFLEECIATSRNPQNHFFYCKICPLERSKNDGGLEPCKGHLKRKFIKECWSKCGCGKQCGNRIIQRGITCKLQVFFTSEGKGWGLRTLEDLPKGAFVCEFVGEILSIKELHERNMKCTGKGNHTYPVLLDANWDSGSMKNEEALCLDSASFGNIARFINHRCFDANLVEIPVEVEDPGHYYYHFAFFTSRKVAALEELTWDYGIDFDDHDHHIKLFQCSCGSKLCRHVKRSNRSSRSASISG